MSHDKIKYTIYARFLQVQRMYRLINTMRFEEIYNLCTPEEQDELIKKIDALDKTGLEVLLKKKEYHTLKSLRETASRLGIKNYTYLSRSSLLSEIEKVNNAKQLNPT